MVYPTYEDIDTLDKVKMMNFVLKTRNVVSKIRNCVSKTRNCVFKIMEFEGGGGAG